MKGNRYYIALSVIFFAVILAGCGHKPKVMPEAPLIFDVVYPKDVGPEGNRLPDPEVDSTFALGSVNPVDSRVIVNGVEAKVWKNGAFLDWFPMNEDTLYRFTAISPSGDSIVYVHPFKAEIIELDSVEAEQQQVFRQNYLDSILSQLPARMVVTDSHAVVKTEPNQGYWFFPPAGTVVWADSFKSSYYRIKLEENLHGWIEDRFVEYDSTSSKPPWAIIHSLKVTSDSKASYLKIPIRERLPFIIDESPDGNSLTFRLFGAYAYMDQVKYSQPDSLIRDVRWRKPNDQTLELKFSTGLSHYWGYDDYYVDNDLIIEVRRPPELKQRILKDRIIAIDPGHGGDLLGAIGPTRLAEKDVNLAIAAEVSKLLTKKGVKVIQTRKDDSPIGLYERIDVAVKAGAEILLSIHNNAIADGNNPFLNTGSSVYYYHAQSRSLAEAMHKSLLEASGLNDNGIYYKNLALARPSNCLAVLIECAFIIHPDEELLLQDKRFIKRIAKGIVSGVEEYLKMERKTKKRYRSYYYYDVPNTIKKPIWHPITNQRENE